MESGIRSAALSSDYFILLRGTTFFHFRTQINHQWKKFSYDLVMKFNFQLRRQDTQLYQNTVDLVWDILSRS